MKRVFIIHGWQADPDCNWFPWLQSELENKGIEAVVPAMPNSAYPELKDWLEYLRGLIGVPDENTILVGHSLGTITILKYLEKLKEGERVGGVILVAGFSERLGPPEIASFTAEALDYELVKKGAKKIIAIASDNDPLIPITFTEILEHKLGAELIIMPGRGHLNDGNGYFQLPEVLVEILKMTKN